MFDILFKGECQPQQDVETVKQNMASLFKISAEKAAGLFSGQSLTLKRDLDKEVASKYIKAIASAGAIAYAVESGVAAQTTSEASSSADTVAEPDQATDSDTGSEQAQPDSMPEHEAVVTQGSVLDAEIDPPGTVLLEHERVQPAEIDTSGMSLSQPGETLVEATEIPDAAIEIDHLSLSEAGSSLLDK